MKRTDVAALLLAIFGVVLSVFVAYSVYEGLPHLEDEFAFLWEAEVMAGGRIELPTPFEKRSLLVPFVVDYEGHRFGKYPPGWPATLSLGVRVGAPWAVNALMAGFSLWLIYRLGSRIAGPGVGLLAEILSLTSPMFLMLSGSMLSHIFSLFLALTFTLAWLELFPLKKGSERNEAIPSWMLLAIAGLSMGLLAITRPLTAVGVGLPFLALGVVNFVSGNRFTRSHLVGIAVLAALGAALLLVWNSALTGKALLNPYTLWWGYDRIGFGPGIGVTDTGHNLTLAFWNLRWSLRSGLHDLFGWPYLSWVFLPFGLIALRRNKEGWLVFSIFPALILVYMAYWVGAWLYGPRYYFEALPGIAIVSAMGIFWLGGLLGKAREGVRWRGLLVGSLVVILVVVNILYYLPPRLAMMNQLNGISRSHLEPFETEILDKTLIIVHVQERWTEYGTLLTLTPPFSDDRLVIVYGRGQPADTRLASGYSGWDVLHYYPDTPETFYREPRTTIVHDRD